jgi:hypothetical protein
MNQAPYATMSLILSVTLTTQPHERLWSRPRGTFGLPQQVFGAVLEKAG